MGLVGYWGWGGRKEGRKGGRRVCVDIVVIFKRGEVDSR